MIPKIGKKISTAGDWFGWFATESGKTFTLRCAVTLGIGTVSFNLFSHTLFLDNYRELFQLYRKSTPVRLAPNVRQQFDSVLADLKVPPETRSLLRPFMVIGSDLLHAGTTHAKSGAIIGIPMNFTYESVDDIDKSNFVLRERKIDWKHANSDDFLQALVLSEREKNFALAQEVIRCQTLEPLLTSFYPAFGIGLAYILGWRTNIILNGFARPFLWRAMLYLLAGFFSFGNWAALKDFTTIHYDTYCLEETSKLGEDYIKGGQEFYGKILKRNKAIRNMLGEYGISLYSATGNDQFFLREKRLPIASRKSFFDKQVEGSNL